MAKKRAKRTIRRATKKVVRKLTGKAIRNRAEILASRAIRATARSVAKRGVRKTAKLAVKKATRCLKCGVPLSGHLHKHILEPLFGIKSSKKKIGHCCKCD